MHVNSIVAPCWATTLVVRDQRSKKTSQPFAGSKVITPAGDTVRAFDAGYKFKFERTLIEGWSDARSLLDGLAYDDKRILVLGEPVAWPMPGWHRRTLSDDPRTGEAATLRKGEHRLLVMDLDGAAPPGVERLDPVADPEACVAAVLTLLPAPFRDASVWWTFTSSQRPFPSPGLRLRLVFILARPWPLLEMKRWSKTLDPRLNADGSIYSGNQPVYLARPIIEGGHPDPLHQRVGMRTGVCEVVDAEPPQPVGVSPSVGGASGVYLADEDDPLSLIGDHVGGAGCYQGLLHATFHLVRRYGDSLADAEIKRLVRERVEVAQWVDVVHCDPAYRAEQISDRKLDAMIRGARAKLQQLVGGVPPEYPSRPMTYGAAVAALDAAVIDCLWDAAIGEAGPTLVQAPAGLGKTTAMLRAVVDAGLRADVYVPSHRLAEELATKVHEMGGTAAVMRGRTRDDGDPVLPLPLCHKGELAAKLAAKGVTWLQQHLCISATPDGTAKCPAFGECGYARQFRTTSSVRIFTHAVLPLDPNIFEKDAAPSSLTVVDESPWSALVQTERWPLADVRAAGGVIAEIGEILAAGLPLLHELRVRYADAVPAVTTAMDALQRTAVPITPADDEQTGLSRLEQMQQVTAGFASLLEAVIDGLRTGEDVFNSVWLVADADRCEWLYLARLRRPVRLRAAAGKVVLLDATPNVPAWEAVLPGLKVERVTVERQATVVQVYDTALGKTRLAANAALVDDIDGLVRGAALQFGSVGVCGPKLLTSELESRCHAAVDAGLVRLANFGGLRGLDSLRDTAVGIVVGRNQPPAFDVERVARAIWPHEPLKLSGTYVRRPIGYRMRDGSHVGVLVQDHEDPRVRTVLRQFREAESEQALDRHRLVHRHEPKVILLLSSLPLDVDVDHLVALRDVLGHPGLGGRLTERGGVLPLGADWLSANVRGFDSRKAAEHWAARAGITPAFRQAPRPSNNPHFPICIYGVSGVIPRPHRHVAYRLRGERGRARRAVTTRLALNEVRDLLARHHGVGAANDVVALQWADAVPRATVLTEGSAVSPAIRLLPIAHMLDATSFGGTSNA